jgi:uncharacterized damage-inducible protein DinB
MTRAGAIPAQDFCQSVLETYAINERMNQIILHRLHPDAWRANPGRSTRTIAAIFTHMHNIRRKWLRLSAPHLMLPAQLDRTRCTQRQAQVALEESARLCSEMLAEALRADGRVKQFRRDGWAKAWPPGVSMFAYMTLHDAHHRGQVCMLAHLWEKLWKQCGFASPR